MRKYIVPSRLWEGLCCIFLAGVFLSFTVQAQSRFTGTAKGTMIEHHTAYSGQKRAHKICVATVQYRVGNKNYTEQKAKCVQNQLVRYDPKNPANYIESNVGPWGVFSAVAMFCIGVGLLCGGILAAKKRRESSRKTETLNFHEDEEHMSMGLYGLGYVFRMSP